MGTSNKKLSPNQEKQKQQKNIAVETQRTMLNMLSLKICTGMSLIHLVDPTLPA